MAEKETRKANRTKEQIIKEFDDKIAYHEKCIESLKAKKEEVLNPKVSPKQQLKAVLAKAEESGLSPEDISLSPILLLNFQLFTNSWFL